MITTIAWKNVWRNKKRSAIVIIAVTLGITAGVFIAGLLHGWFNQRVETVIYTESGHIKLYHPAFLNNEDINCIIPKSEEITAFLNQNQTVKAYSKHRKLVTMGVTSRGNAALYLVGIQPEEEKNVSNLYQYILPEMGSFFEDAGSFPILISDRTAEQLRIKLYMLTADSITQLQQAGVPEPLLAKLSVIQDERFFTEDKMKKKLTSLLTATEADRYGKLILDASKRYQLRAKIVFTFTDKNGELINQAFKVCGIYNTDNALFDQRNAFVLHSDLIPLTGLNKDEYHEISLLLHTNEEITNVQTEIKKAFPELSVMTWKEIAPDVAMYADYQNFYMFIIMIFIILALSFGIVNTMLMAILERTKELGMLMAIGMNKKRVFSMIMMETLFLTLTGAFAGMSCGWLIIKITGQTGIHFTSVSQGLEAFGWSASVYPTIGMGFFFGITVLVILAAILSAIVPARKALNLNPVDAIRTE
jgi:ABC-type lipoprotein release transport system permease subunit